jgi:hypothetical protein
MPYPPPAAGRDPCIEVIRLLCRRVRAVARQHDMAEGFELVRTLRQHLRRGAILLEEGRFDDAVAEADAALALDPQSLPGQALRDRFTRL